MTTIMTIITTTKIRVILWKKRNKTAKIFKKTTAIVISKIQTLKQKWRKKNPTKNNIEKSKRKIDKKSKRIKRI